MRTPNIRSSLFANSLYLMLATGAVTGLGFVFWVIIARSYSAETVGVATTLLSLSGLISLLSLAGFDTTLVRFLPRSSRKNDYINSGLMVVAALSIVLSLGGIGLLRWTSPSTRTRRGGFARGSPRAPSSRSPRRPTATSGSARSSAYFASTV